MTSDDLVVHEAGGSDTIIDIVGAFALLDALGVERVVCSPIPYARGLIGTRHGTIPGPGPAVLALLGGALLTGVDAESELVTPTGAAIVATVATSFGELPAMRLPQIWRLTHDPSPRSQFAQVQPYRIATRATATPQ